MQSEVSIGISTFVEYKLTDKKLELARNQHDLLEQKREEQRKKLREIIMKREKTNTLLQQYMLIRMKKEYCLNIKETIYNYISQSQEVPKELIKLDNECNEMIKSLPSNLTELERDVRSYVVPNIMTNGMINNLSLSSSTKGSNNRNTDYINQSITHNSISLKTNEALQTKPMSAFTVSKDGFRIPDNTQSDSELNLKKEESKPKKNN